MAAGPPALIPGLRPGTLWARLRRGAAIGWTALLAVALWTVDWSVFGYRWTNGHLVREVGLLAYAFYDAGSQAWRGAFEDVADVDPTPYVSFTLERHARRTAMLARLAGSAESTHGERRKNIILLQLESVDAAALDATLDGAPAMPFFRALRDRTWSFDNVIDQTGVGRSSDAHVLVLASLIPTQNEPIFTRRDLSDTISLPKLLASRGYHCFSMEGSEGEFWRWQVNHQRLGYHVSYSKSELDDTDRLGWGVSDRSLIVQAATKMREHVARSPQQPFLAHVVLLTNHHPFTFVRDALGRTTGGILQDYLLSVRYTDEVIELLFGELERSGLLDRTIVAVYSDHDSGISDELETSLGRTYRPGSENERIPLMIWGLGAPRRITRPTGLQDLAPTILTAIGLPIPPRFVGIPGQLDSADVLLQNGTRVTGLTEGGLPVVSPIDVDIRTHSLLAIERPSVLP